MQNEFEDFCHQNEAQLSNIKPYYRNYFQINLTKFLIKQKIENLTTKVRQCRHQYSNTMKDLQLISDMLRQ